MDEPVPKVWAVKMDGQTVQLRDLLIRDLEAIENESGVNWLDMLDAPGRNAAVARLLLEAVARKVGTEAPEFTAREAGNLFVLVDDDLPVDMLPVEPGEPDPTNGSAASTAG